MRGRIVGKKGTIGGDLKSVLGGKGLKYGF